MGAPNRLGARTDTYAILTRILILLMLLILLLILITRTNTSTCTEAGWSQQPSPRPSTAPPLWLASGRGRDKRLCLRKCHRYPTLCHACFLTHTHTFCHKYHTLCHTYRTLCHRCHTLRREQSTTGDRGASAC